MPRKSRKRDPDYEPTGTRTWGSAIHDEALVAANRFFPSTFRLVYGSGLIHYEEKEKKPEPDPYKANGRKKADPSTVPDDPIDDLWRGAPETVTWRERLFKIRGTGSEDE